MKKRILTILTYMLTILAYIGVVIAILTIIESFHLSLEIIRRKYDIAFPSWWEPLMIFDHSGLDLTFVLCSLPLFVGAFLKKLNYLWKPAIILGFLWEFSLFGRFLYNYPYRFSTIVLDDGSVVFDLTQGPLQYDWIARDLLFVLSGLAFFIVGIILRVIKKGQSRQYPKEPRVKAVD